MEIEELRETYSASYLTSSNTRLSFYYGSPVHYLDDDGHYQPIDTSFKKDKNYFMTKANSNNVIINDGYLSINNDICIDCFDKNYSVKDNCIYYKDVSIESLATGVLIKKTTHLINKANYTYGGDYHFMWQTSSGSWAEKIGSNANSSYGEHSASNYPSYGSWGVYNSDTYYFAIWTE